MQRYKDEEGDRVAGEEQAERGRLQDGLGGDPEPEGGDRGAALEEEERADKRSDPAHVPAVVGGEGGRGNLRELGVDDHLDRPEKTGVGGGDREVEDGESGHGSASEQGKTFTRGRNRAGVPVRDRLPLRRKLLSLLGVKEASSGNSGPVIEGSAVARMFGGIAGRYDRANRVLSGGIDRYWRWRTVRAVLRESPRRVVDLATGSGDIALALRRQLPAETTVEGLDFCEPMLEEARRKQGGQSGLRFAFGDCLALPLEDASVDVLTIGFGLRNLEDRDRGLREMRRVLRPGGALFVLEFSQPYAWLRPLYYPYLEKLLPWVAGRLTGDSEAYRYLGGTIRSFPRREVLAEQMRSAGFAAVRARALTGGIVALHRAEKGGGSPER